MFGVTVPKYTIPLELTFDDVQTEAWVKVPVDVDVFCGNAIVAMRFDTSEMGANWTEICAYGTAVKVRKLS